MPDMPTSVGAEAEEAGRRATAEGGSVAVRRSDGTYTTRVVGGARRVAVRPGAEEPATATAIGVRPTTSATFRLPGAASSLAGAAALRSETEALAALVRARSEHGTVVRLDGKEGCDAGPFGNDYSRTRTNAFDPAWCTRDRDRIQPPVLRLDVSCTDLATLFWPDVYERAQRALSSALMSKPTPRDAWSLRMQWTRDVMTLVSIALEATNIQPIFAWPAAWATVQPKMGFDDEGVLKPFGEYTSGFTFDGAPMRSWPDGTTKVVAGRCTPRGLHDFTLSWYERGLQSLRNSRTLTAWRASRDRFRSEFGVPGAWNETETQDVRIRIPPINGVHFAREATGFGLTPCAGPAMMSGSLIANESPTIKALRGAHDPWSSMGFPASGDGPLVLPRAMFARAGEDGRRVAHSFSDACTFPCRPDWDAVGRVRKRYAGKSLEHYMRDLFIATQGEESALVQGYTNGDWGNAGMTGRTRDELRRAAGGSSDEQIKRNMRVPNSQWWLEAAAAWGAVIANLPFENYVTNATTFYLVNHFAYFDLKGLANMSPVEAATLAEGARQMRLQVAGMGHAMGAAMVTRMNATAGRIASDLTQSISDDVSRYAHFPEYPKSLYRRISSVEECGGGPDPERKIPWLVVGGGVVAGVGLAYFLKS